MADEPEIGARFQKSIFDVTFSHMCHVPKSHVTALLGLGGAHSLVSVGR